VQAVDGPHVAVVALTGFRTMASCLGKVFNLNADEVVFRQLSPAYVEAMTGKRVIPLPPVRLTWYPVVDPDGALKAEIATLKDKLAEAEARVEQLKKENHALVGPIYHLEDRLAGLFDYTRDARQSLQAIRKEAGEQR